MILRCLPAWLRGLPRGRDRGSAMLEFALIAPVFILGFAGVIDLGYVMWMQIRLESALEAGASFALLPTSIAMVTPTNAATLATDIASLVTTSDPAPTPNTTVVVNNGPSVTVTNGTSSSGGSGTNVDTSYYCPTGSPPNWSWGSSVASGTACSGGGQAGQFVTITASFSYTAFFPLYHFVSNGMMTMGTVVQTK